jgi:hypothetical protein
LYWFISWAIGGGVIGIFTTPYWQTPWYKYEGLDLKQDKPAVDARLSSMRWTQKLGMTKKDDDDHPAA